MAEPDLRMRFFGPEGNDVLEHVETPVGVPCVHCHVPIVYDDVGLMVASIEEDGATFRPWHRWCLARNVGVLDDDTPNDPIF